MSIVSGRALAAIAAIALMSGPVFGQAKTSLPTITVADIGQFLRAVGSNRTLVLKKGDYLLKDAYSIKTSFVSWTDAEDGKELTIKGAENLTIRGADGARIVTDSGAAYFLGIYGGKNITLDNLRLSRTLKDGVDASAGSLYVESVRGFTLDRSLIEGPTNTALEFSECSDVAVKRTEIRGASSGALSVVSTSGLAFSASKVSKSEGYPLVYIEDSVQLVFSDTRFEGNSGGNFIEIYAQSDSAPSVVFQKCAFSGNDVEFFSGTSLLPGTLNCSFDGNSFGEDWAEKSVAASEDQSYYGEDTGPAYYEHYDSGLAFYYPRSWELQENSGANGRLGVYSPDGGSLVIFMTVSKLPGNADPSSDAVKLLADASAALVATMKDEGGLSVSMSSDTFPIESGGFVSQDFSGEATKGEGEHAFLKARLFINEGAVHAMVALVKDQADLEPGSEAGQILASVELSGGEE